MDENMWRIKCKAPPVVRMLQWLGSRISSKGPCGRGFVLWLGVIRGDGNFKK
jgi:hypothetical protein